MSDSQTKRDGFGIGEAGKVPASTPEDEAEAERLQPTPRGEMVRCGHCHQMYPRHLGMSSAHGTVCPDCYDDCSE
jgi:Zn ribbon nucleic-acid-binding protein